MIPVLHKLRFYLSIMINSSITGAAMRSAATGPTNFLDGEDTHASNILEIGAMMPFVLPKRCSHDCQPLI